MVLIYLQTNLNAAWEESLQHKDSRMNVCCMKDLNTVKSLGNL